MSVARAIGLLRGLEFKLNIAADSIRDDIRGAVEEALDEYRESPDVFDRSIMSVRMDEARKHIQEAETQLRSAGADIKEALLKLGEAEQSAEVTPRMAQILATVGLGPNASPGLVAHNVTQAELADLSRAGLIDINGQLTTEGMALATKPFESGSERPTIPPSPGMMRGEPAPLHGLSVANLPGLLDKTDLTLIHQYDDQYSVVDSKGVQYFRDSEAQLRPYVLPTGMTQSRIDRITQGEPGTQRPPRGSGGQVRTRPQFRGRG